MVFSSILQNGGPKPKNFWGKWGTKQAPNIIYQIISLACAKQLNIKVPHMFMLALAYMLHKV
jgi:hypothetical protein